LGTYLPILVVPARSKLIAAISEPYVGMKKEPLTGGIVAIRNYGGNAWLRSQPQKRTA